MGLSYPWYIWRVLVNDMGAVFSVAVVSRELNVFADLWGTGEIVDILLGRGDDGSTGVVVG